MDHPLRNAGMGSQLKFKRSQYGLLVEALNRVLKRLEGYCFVGGCRGLGSSGSVGRCARPGTVTMAFTAAKNQNPEGYFLCVYKNSMISAIITTTRATITKTTPNVELSINDYLPP